MMGLPFLYVVEIRLGGLEWTDDWKLVPMCSVPQSERGGLIPGLKKDVGVGLLLECDSEPHVFRKKKDAAARELEIRRFLRPHGRGWSATRVARYEWTSAVARGKGGWL